MLAGRNVRGDLTRLNRNDSVAGTRSCDALVARKNRRTVWCG